MKSEPESRFENGVDMKVALSNIILPYFLYGMYMLRNVHVMAVSCSLVMLAHEVSCVNYF